MVLGNYIYTEKKLEKKEEVLTKKLKRSLNDRHKQTYGRLTETFR
jgi:hypothetical protein